VGAGHQGLILSRLVVMSAVTLAKLEFGIACLSIAAVAANRAALACGPIRAAQKDRNRDALDKLTASHAVA
jgi:hypothetical protein